MSRAGGRPGTGGRQPRLSAYALTTATQELYDEHGEPRHSSHRGAQMLVWLVNPEGDGALVVRLSYRDVHQGETAMEQVHPLRDFEKAQKLQARYIIVTVNNSGRRRYENRPDFELLEREINRAGLRWVAFERVDRIAREDLPFALFKDFLLRTETKLYIAEWGREVDWDNDRLQFGVQGLVAADGAVRIKKNTHGALDRRWVAEGRGWPGLKRFGFLRNELTKFLEVDPEQWRFVKMIFYLYVCLESPTGGTGVGGVRKALAEAGCSLSESQIQRILESRNGGTGIRGVKKALAEAGCSLSESQIRRILSDPIYVTGEYSFNREGVRTAGRPVKLEQPIPVHVFQRANELLDLRRGKTTRRPPGFFCLNGLVIHEDCELSLEARIQGNRPGFFYRHRSPIPCGCRGFAIEARALERAVIRELRRLNAIRELQDEWTRAARPEYGLSSPILTKEERRAIERQIKSHQATKDKIAKDFVSRLANGAKGNELDYGELVGYINDAIAALQSQIDLSEELAQAQERGEPIWATDEDLAALSEALESVLTEDVPDDPYLIAKRASVVRACLSKVVVREQNGEIEVELHGPLVPKDLPLLRPFSPAEAAEALLTDLENEESAEEAMALHTVPQGMPYRAVCSSDFEPEQMSAAWIGTLALSRPESTPAGGLADEGHDAAAQTVPPDSIRTSRGSRVVSPYSRRVRQEASTRSETGLVALRAQKWPSPLGRSATTVSPSPSRLAIRARRRPRCAGSPPTARARRRTLMKLGPAGRAMGAVMKEFRFGPTGMPPKRR